MNPNGQKPLPTESTALVFEQVESPRVKLVRGRQNAEPAPIPGQGATIPLPGKVWGRKKDNQHLEAQNPPLSHPFINALSDPSFAYPFRLVPCPPSLCI